MPATCCPGFRIPHYFANNFFQRSDRPRTPYADSFPSLFVAGNDTHTFVVTTPPAPLEAPGRLLAPFSHADVLCFQVWPHRRGRHPLLDCHGARSQALDVSSTGSDKAALSTSCLQLLVFVALPAPLSCVDVSPHAHCHRKTCRTANATSTLSKSPFHSTSPASGLLCVTRDTDSQTYSRRMRDARQAPRKSRPQLTFLSSTKHKTVALPQAGSRRAGCDGPGLRLPVCMHVFDSLPSL